MPLDSYEICCGEMPLVVMKYVGAKDMEIRMLR